MKKTLVALAAIAATASFAQVTITGNLDIAGAAVSGTKTPGATTSFTSTIGTSSTTGIKITAAEDLGGGLKATAMFELDPRSLVNDSLGLHAIAATTAITTGVAVLNQTVTGLGAHEAFVSLSGGFGEVKMGRPNSQSLAVSGVSSPLGTGIGSGYTYNGASASNWSQISGTRYARSVKYESPVVNGLQFAITHAPGADQANTTSGLLAVPNNRTTTDLGLTYNTGGLTLAWANVSQLAQQNATGYYATTSSTNVASAAATNANVFAARYNMGQFSLHGGFGSGTALTSATSAVDIKVWRVGVKATFGKVDAIAQVTEAKTNPSATTETIQKTTGLRLDYNLSKTAAAYMGIEQYDSGATTSNQQNITAIGLRKSF